MLFLSVKLQMSDYFHVGLIIAENLKSFVNALSLSEKAGLSNLFFSALCNTLAVSAPV